MRNMFTLRTTSYNLHGNYIQTLPVSKTNSYAIALFLNMPLNYGIHCRTLFEL